MREAYQLSIEDEIAEEFNSLCINDLEEPKSVGVVYQNLQTGKDYQTRDFTIFKRSQGRPFNIIKLDEFKVFTSLVKDGDCVIKSALKCNITIPTALRWSDHLESECKKRGIPFFIDWDKHAPYGRTKTAIRNNPVHNVNRNLSETFVEHIKKALNEGVSFYQLGYAYGCSPSTIGLILNGQTWASVLPFTYRQIEIALRRDELGTANKLDYRILDMKY